MKPRIPSTLLWLGAPCTVAALLLAARVGWEQTLLTWERGPQMIGFSLMHSGAGIMLLLPFWVGQAWFLAYIAVAARRRSLGGRIGLGLLSAYALSWAVVAAPSAWWQLPVASRLAKGHHAAEFLSIAAAEGSLALVKALLNAGLSPNARNGDKSTALHGAAVRGRLEVAQLLVARGADINPINEYGDSPLANAESENQVEVATYLRSRGAISINAPRGDKARKPEPLSKGQTIN